MVRRLHSAGGSAREENQHVRRVSPAEHRRSMSAPMIGEAAATSHNSCKSTARSLALQSAKSRLANALAMALKPSSYVVSVRREDAAEQTGTAELTARAVAATAASAAASADPASAKPEANVATTDSSDPADTDAK